MDFYVLSNKWFWRHDVTKTFLELLEKEINLLNEKTFLDFGGIRSLYDLVDIADIVEFIGRIQISSMFHLQ